MAVFVQCGHEFTTGIENLGCRGEGEMTFFRINTTTTTKKKQQEDIWKINVKNTQLKRI